MTTNATDLFEMLTWAFNLGQHSDELKRLENILSKYVDKGAVDEFYQVQKKDLEHIWHRLQFISINMVP